jgi:pimeloyl-ACP methyl ester carboxylesterase
MIGTKPYAKLKYREVKGRQMAYIDEGEGDAIVFQHAQPASSCVWRNVMPHLEGRCRLIACDLIGMGRSEKLSPSGPDRYRYSEHRDHLFALWDALDLGDRVLLVLDDWGAVLGLDWARQNSHRVQGIVHMEAVAAPLNWSDLSEEARSLFRALRSKSRPSKRWENRWRGNGLTSPDISQALMSSTTAGSGASSERAKHHGLRRLGRVLVDPLSHPIERREIPPRESLTMSPWSN